MIKMISGTTRIGTYTRTPESGSFTADAHTEARLVRRGVARYVDAIVSPPPEHDPKDEDDNTSPDEDEDSGERTVATTAGGENTSGEGDNPPGDGTGTEGEEGRIVKPVYSANMGMDELKANLRSCGLVFTVGMSKADIVAALDAYYADPEDDNELPDLEAEEPYIMGGFKDMIAADIHKVFLNPAEFSELRTIIYDGETYEDIPVVLSGLKEKDRRALVNDHAQGLYQVTSILHCAISDLGGNQPEKGARIKINDKEGGGGFYSEFYVAASVCEMGMLRIELEAVSE